MIDQQQPQFSIAELGAKFGAQLGQAHAEIITLEKTNEALESELARMRANEASLVSYIQEIEAKLKELETDDKVHPLSKKAAEIAARPIKKAALSDG